MSATPGHHLICDCLACRDNRLALGRQHYERRIAQQRAADKRRVKRKDDYDWKKEQ